MPGGLLEAVFLERAYPSRSFFVANTDPMNMNGPRVRGGRKWRFTSLRRLAARSQPKAGAVPVAGSSASTRAYGVRPTAPRSSVHGASRVHLRKGSRWNLDALLTTGPPPLSTTERITQEDPRQTTTRSGARTHAVECASDSPTAGSSRCPAGA